MKTLVIAEKPSMAKDIAKALKDNFSQKDGYWEGRKYIITYAIGHLVSLAEPEKYDAKFVKWSLANLPIVPQKFKLKVIKGQEKQFNTIKKLLSSANEVINACDAGREGELIFRYIISLAGFKGSIKRLWISSLTEEAILEGFKNLKDGSLYTNLYHAAECRSIGDWLIGINATRAYTVKNNTLLSVGRVQTPTLALIVQRDNEITNFIPKDYWQVLGCFTSGKGEYTGKWLVDNEDKIWDLEKAEKIKAKVENKEGKIVSVEEIEKKENPPLLYDLTTLQREANKKYGFIAAKTLDLAQALYDKHKLITYPRTDARFLTYDISGTIGERLEAINTEKYQIFIEHIFKENLKPAKKIFNDAKVSDHHAIIPTEKACKNNLSEAENKIYDMIVRRFISVFYPPCIYRDTKVITEVEKETFLSQGKVILQRGWRLIEAGGPKEEEIPELKKGLLVNLNSVKVKKDSTKPPKRFNENTLLGAMENAGKIIEDEELQVIMKDSGLGTPATRAAIIERLKKVGYIETKGKSLLATSKGIELIKKINTPVLKLPELTGGWEKRLKDIELGKEKPEKFKEDIKQLTFEIIEKARESKTMDIQTPDKEILGKCPLCGGNVLEGKKTYGCSNWKAENGGCKFTIWKVIAKKKISKSQAKELINNGKTKIIKGFTSKKGTKFDAKLKIDGGKVVFDFDK